MNPNSIQSLSDEQLVRDVETAAAHERSATVQLIGLLAEMDRRRLYLQQGYSSLFTYCTGCLHLSEHAAYGRIEAARASRKFPIILERLADGSITLTTICLLSNHLTQENHEQLLIAARHKTRREVEQLVATLRPMPEVPSTVRKLPQPTPLMATRRTVRQVASDCSDRYEITNRVHSRTATACAVGSLRRSFDRSPRSVTRCSSRSDPRPTENCGSFKTSCAMPSPTGTWRRSSIAR